MNRHNPNALVIVVMLLGLAVSPVAFGALVQRTQSQTARAIVVDHESVALFEQIPAQYIAAARGLNMVFLDKSVGENIDTGLTCLTGHGVASCGITGDQPYQRTLWSYDWFSEAGCSAWNELMPCLVDQTHWAIDYYDVVMFGFSYMEVEQAGALAYFDSTDGAHEIGDYVAYLVEHGKPVVHWTSSLNRGADDSAESWNELMRGYAGASGAHLFDLANILSHRPDGSECLALDGIHPGICWPDYTSQTTSGGGHLNKAGQIRTAKALWVLMAQLAGWVPPGAEPEPSATATATDTPQPTPTATSILQSPIATPTEPPPITVVTPTDGPTPTHTPVPMPTQPTVTPTFTPTPTAAPGGLCPFDARTSATVAGALQLWLEVWPSAQRYRDAANGSGSVEPLTEAEVSALIAACWTRANVLDAGFYK